jgi:gas vesicle protein
MGRIADVQHRHPLAAGILAGTAVGVSLGLLFAPRRGSDTRKKMKEGVNHIATSTSSGYRRAKGAVGQLANRGHGAYVTTREHVVKGAKGTGQYVRDIADAVTRKARQSDNPHRRVTPSSPAGQPRKAI